MPGQQLAAVFTAIIVVAAAQGQTQVSGSGSVWTRADVQCAPEDSPAAIFRLPAITEINCVALASEKAPTGALVAQFNQLTRTCTIFDFQSICRNLPAGQSSNCAVFYRFPIDHRLLNPKLNNVWLADDVSRLENLVCQADDETNRLHPVGVQWSSDGAKFDGISAYAKLNKSSISFATGVTWLLKIKRQPRVQPYFEFINCSILGSSVTSGTHLWEYGSPRQLYVRMGKITGTLMPSVNSQANALPAGPDDWLNIGVTSTATGNPYDIFVGNSFLPRGSLTSWNNPEVPMSSLCMFVGMRITSGGKEMFNGTLRAMAFASVNMSETEIRHCFDLIG